MKKQESRVNKGDNNMSKQKPVVPDTSVLISGVLRELVEKKEVEEIIIPEFVVEEMRAQASRGREIGFRGLEELKELRKIAKIKKVGRRQTMDEIKLAKYGRVDALIMDVAKKEKALLLTSDRVQALAAEAEGIEVQFFEPYTKKGEIKLKELFDKETTSIHLKENVRPLAKKGKPGKTKLVPIGEPLNAKQIEEIIKEVMDAVRYEEDAFLEMGGHQASVIQLGNIRIAISHPPFSEALELTAVRPIAKVSLDDYKYAKDLKKRLIDKTRGVLIAGPPGSGKSTFAAAVAEFYQQKGNIVKTLESPRDLQVGPEITQYTKLKGSFVETADVLLLVRPDYTIFDEVRKTQEFEVFSDMRLAGIGMVGVVHASEPIDAVQRFIGRVELGMIPHIIDTVVHIEAGEIKDIYELQMVVRTPFGMTEADLARPIVEVKNFHTGKLAYEIYSYGEENVIVPVTEEKQSAVKELAKKHIINALHRYDKRPVVELPNDNKAVVKVDNRVVPRLIGKEGKTISALEQELGISIDVTPKISTMGKEISFRRKETGAYLVFMFKKLRTGTTVNIYADNEFILSSAVGKNSQIRINKNSDIGKKLLQELIKKKVKVFV
jgi:ATPase